MTYFGIRNIGLAAAPDSALVTGVSLEILPENEARTAVYFMNAGNKEIFFAFGANAAIANNGVRLLRDEGFLLESSILTVEAVNAIAPSGDSLLLIQEWGV